MPRVGLVDLPLYTLDEVSDFMANDNMTSESFGTQPLPEVWFSQNFDRDGNGHRLTWSVPDDWEVEIRYHVISSDEILNEGMLNMSSSDTYEPGTNQGWLWAIPPAINSIFYNSQISLPHRAFSPTRGEYLAVIYSFRTTNTIAESTRTREFSDDEVRIFRALRATINTHQRSEWLYTKPIWVYQPD